MNPQVSVDAKRRDRLVIKGKKAVNKGELKNALKYFDQAWKIQGSDKLARSMVELEQKIIQREYPEQYRHFANATHWNHKFENLCSSWEREFHWWPTRQKVSLWLKDSLCDRLDAIWPNLQITSLIDPVLVGRYYLYKKSPWKTFSLWRSLLARENNLQNEDVEELKTQLTTFFARPPHPLLEDVRPKDLEWFSQHTPGHTFKAIVYCHLRFLIYEGEWRKGEKFYTQTVLEFPDVFLKDQTAQTIGASLAFWKMCHDSHGDMDAIAKKAGINRKEDIHSHLAEFFEATKNPREDTHWTSLCRKNPYKLIGLEKTSPDTGKVMFAFARVLAGNKGGSIRKLAEVQKVLQKKSLQRTLKFLYLPDIIPET